MTLFTQLQRKISGKTTKKIMAWTLTSLLLGSASQARPLDPQFEAQRQALIKKLIEENNLGKTQQAKLRQVFARSRILGQGNPRATQYAMTRQACEQKNWLLKKSIIRIHSLKKSAKAPIWLPSTLEEEKNQNRQDTV